MPSWHGGTKFCQPPVAIGSSTNGGTDGGKKVFI
jgi:hypothetical protein